MLAIFLASIYQEIVIVLSIALYLHYGKAKEAYSSIDLGALGRWLNGDWGDNLLCMRQTSQIQYPEGIYNKVFCLNNWRGWGFGGVMDNQREMTN